MNPEYEDSAIAIIAMECRIPGADNVDKLWDLLLAGHSPLRDLSDEELADAGVAARTRSQADYVRRASILEDVDKFDAGYFDISPREADVLDVQQRMMLEASVTLLNRANVDPSRCGQRIGVFAGSAFSTYLFGVLEQAELVDTLGEMLVRHSNDKDFLATRISYKLNLEGPSVNVQTSCSTGLVAAHMASQSLLLGECDMAIAGAVSIRLPQHTGYRYQPDGVLARDGVCRPFDEAATGTVFTNGLGLVLLKRLRDAMDDGDDIIAVIAGSAVNNDGGKKVGFTAPSVSGQIDALSAALAVSGVPAEAVQFIEAHGTGTTLGDPIEVEAIRRAYGEDGPPCAIGSVKGHFGHFNIAAGIIGLIKAALVVKHGVIPPTLHLERVNPALGLEGSRFFVPADTRHLETGRTRFAAVSAFGMGGTNSHAIVKSPPARKAAVPPAAGVIERPQVLAFSARSEKALARMAASLADHFSAHQDASFADAAHTALTGRPRFGWRAAIVARDASEAAARLRSGDFPRGTEGAKPGLAFVFGGQGTQRQGMGQDLALHCEPFRRHLDLALAAFDEGTRAALSALIWGPAGQDPQDTGVAQPLVFAVEYALARTLMDSGLQPDYLVGHSLGELVAAAVSGIFSLETAAQLVTVRARAMAACEPGAMLSVDALAPYEPLIREGRIAVAARNAERQLVLSGPFAAIEACEAIARQQGLACQRLRTSHAFHSPMMAAAAAEFHACLAGVKFEAARIPIVANITGRVLTEYEYRNPGYWSDHLLRTVQFSDSIQTLLGLGVRQFVEVGSGHAMGNLVRANLRQDATGSCEIVHSLAGVEGEYAAFLEAVALAWTRSPQVELARFVDGRQRVMLPSYPFERQVHWVRPALPFQARAAAPAQVAPREEQPPQACQAATPAAQPAAAPVAAAPAVAQANPVEAMVAEIYQSFLGGSTHQPEQTFFERGGNSLLAIQLINRLRETFQIDIPLRGFYQQSSVSAISRYIAEALLKEPAHV